MNNKIYIIDESGMRLDARILSKFRLENEINSSKNVTNKAFDYIRTHLFL